MSASTRHPKNSPEPAFQHLQRSPLSAAVSGWSLSLLLHLAGMTGFVFLALNQPPVRLRALPIEEAQAHSAGKVSKGVSLAERRAAETQRQAAELLQTERALTQVR